MTYTVLARRYRSRDFDEIVGQQAVAKTLRSAIEQDRIAHAYLFCGTRGVGKTSMARIFAKALNASDDLSEKDRIGDAIMRGEDLDVIEIDGASTRGIQEARDLIAGAGLAPSRCRYKIYIIDEVHMLTLHAFNALLKTMEEPPDHVKFILATTDPHKVPATIQSRCQRFDFRSLTTEEVGDQLRYILSQESVESDDDVVHHVARLGNGSMRDALSILDRLLATGESRLTMPLLQETLGLPDQALIIRLVDAIVQSDPALALQTVRDLLSNGATADQVLDLLAEYFRDLMVLQTCGTDTDLVDLAGDARKSAATHAQSFDVPGLVHLIAMSDAIGRSARAATTARALIDAAVVRMCLSEHFASIGQVLQDGTMGTAGTASSAGSGIQKKKRPAELNVGTTTASPSVSRGSMTEPKPAAPPLRAPAPQPQARNSGTASAGRGAGGSGSEQHRPSSSAQPAPSAPATPVAIESLTVQTWSRLLSSAELTHAQLAHLDRVAFHSVETSGARPVIRFAADAARTIPADRLEALVRRLLQNERVAVEMVAERSEGEASPAATSAPDDVRNDPLVAEAIDLFDAHIANVEPLDPNKRSSV